MGGAGLLREAVMVVMDWHRALGIGSVTNIITFIIIIIIIMTLQPVT